MARRQCARLTMRSTGKIRALVASAVLAAALCAPLAARAMGEAPVTSGTALEAPAGSALTPDPAPAPVEQGTTLAPPSAADNQPASGGVSAGDTPSEAEAGEGATEPAPEGSAGSLPALPSPSAVLPIPSLPASTCAASGVPPVADPDLPARRRDLRPRPPGPGGAGRDQRGRDRLRHQPRRPSSAGAVGWMQFMPATWAGYGVDANGDGVKDPYNPEDAIFAAASYLSANGMPADTYGAIFAYNHADWYVAEVLANAGCYAAEVGGPGLSRRPQPAAPGAEMRPRPGLERDDPTRVHARLRGRGGALRTRQARRLGAGGDRPPRVRLRPRHGQAAVARAKVRSASTPPSGASTRSTATATDASVTPTRPTPRRPWRG